MPIRKSCLLVVSALVLSILFTSIVYACSRIDLMTVTLHDSSMSGMDGMHGGMVQRGPCNQHKQDICKSVRNRMLSIQPSSYKADDVQQPIILLLPINAIIDIPKHLALSSVSAGWEIAFHSVFKLPLHLSFSVLRI